MTGGTGHEGCFASSSDASDLDLADLASASTMPSLLRKRYVSLDGRLSRHRAAPMYENTKITGIVMHLLAPQVKRSFSHIHNR